MRTVLANKKARTLTFTLIALALTGVVVASQFGNHTSAVGDSSIQDRAHRSPPTISRTSTTAASTPTGAGTYFDHILIVVMEDHGLIDICARNPPPCLSTSGDPYVAGLANTYGIGSHYTGVSHFSQADYVALLGGDTYGCVGYPCTPSAHVNLVDSLEAAGLTWRGYMENQAVATGCDTNYNQPYTPEHNPFVFFTDITSSATRCSKVVLANPSGCVVTDCTLLNDLNSGSAPNFMWLTPNNCDNMHGYTNGCSASIPFGDAYLSSLVPNILNSTTFTTQRAALFVVFDEGNGYCPLNNSSEDCVYAVWAGRGTKNSLVTTNPYSHYSFTRTVETNWNLPSLSTNDATATPMTEFFTYTPPSVSFTYTPANPGPLQTVQFTATATGGIQPYTYAWDFGDGSTASGPTTSHSYTLPGTYTVTIIVKDGVGQNASMSKTVTVSIVLPPIP
ncbi:MAG TPA: PKD domain-containing protein [Candidatus Bathyarchaeia archaeon]|nr:PKD domain-containing protein [Candidatus Bathyarchaeia archaeon]